MKSVTKWNITNYGEQPISRPPPSCLVDPHPQNTLYDIDMVLKKLFKKCSPEIVEYIFSFIGRERTAAMGNFELAIKLEPDDVLTTDDYDPITQSVKTGDLPFLRYLLVARYSQNNLELAFRGVNQKKWDIDEEVVVNVYRYLYTLLDVSSPLLSGTDRFARQSEIHNRIRMWASAHGRIDILEWLTRSKYWRATGSVSFADWTFMALHEQLKLLHYVYERRLFTENDGHPDILLLFALEHDWAEGLAYLHERGARFRTWGADDLGFIRKNAGRLITRTMMTLVALPRDACSACCAWWLPRVGWWGMVLVYEGHGQDVHDHSWDVLTPKARPLEAKPSLRKTLENVGLVHKRRGRNVDVDHFRSRDEAYMARSLGAKPRAQFYLCNALEEAAELGDNGVMRYLERWFSNVRPDPKAVETAVVGNDVEKLRSIYKTFPRFFRKLDFRRFIQPGLKMWRSPEEREGMLEVVQFLHSFGRFRKKLVVLRKLVLNALLTQDVEILAWALIPENGFQFRARDMQKLRRAAARNGSALYVLNDALNAYYPKNDEQDLQKADLAIVGLWPTQDNDI